MSNSNRYDTIIVGAGLGGLATASMLARKGRRVLVLERHYLPGGYATFFKRKDFTFDVSLHSFDGVVDGGSSYDIVRACGVADRIEFIPHKKLYRVIGENLDFSVYHRQIDEYKRGLSQMFPHERENLDRLFAESEKAYEQVGKFFVTSMPFWLKMMMMPFMFYKILKYEHSTVDEFLSRYVQDPQLKKLIAVQWSYYGLPPERLAYNYFGYPFIDYLKFGGYSIRGSSQSLSNALVDVIRENGGSVLTSRTVTKILVEKGRVRGVEGSKDVGTVYADEVISNLSPHATIRLAGAEHFPAKFLTKLDQMEISISGLQVYLGLDCTLAELGVQQDDYIIFVTKKTPLTQQYETMKANEIENGTTAFSLNLFSNIDDTLVPKGKSSLGLFTLCGGEYWQKLSKAEYKARKISVTETLVRQADEVVPGLASHIEVCETGTPRTMTKFTSNPGGSFYGFAQSISQAGMLRRFPQKYPLKGLYQVGAWTFPGAGYIGTLMGAKFLVDRYF